MGVSSSELRGILAVAILAAVWAALVLGILAIASGNASRRLLQTHNNTALTSKARSAVVLGWSALVVVALFWIIHFLSKRRMLL